MATTLPRASWETEALDGRSIEETATCFSSIVTPHINRKGKSVTPQSPERVKGNPRKV